MSEISMEEREAHRKVDMAWEKVLSASATRKTAYRSENKEDLQVAELTLKNANNEYDQAVDALAKFPLRNGKVSY